MILGMSKIIVEDFPKTCLRLKYSSLTYLSLSWTVTILTAFFNFGSNGILINLLDISLIVQLLVLVFSLYFVWQWLKKLYSTAKQIDKGNNLTYRTGWAFWGWVVPIAFFWIPKKMIDQALRVLSGTNSKGLESITKTWWTLWIISILIGNLSFRAFANELYVVEPIILLIESILLTFAYPMWIKVIDTSNKLVSQNQ